MFTENLSASKIVSIKDLREMLLQRSPDASARRDVESPQLSGRDTLTGREHATSRDLSRTSLAHVPQTSPVIQTATSSLVKPPASTSAPSLVPRSSAVEAPRPTGTLASLLSGSQAAEAKAYFTGLLPGKIPPPRMISANGPKPPAVSTNKAVTVPSFTGFTGKLGSATNGTPRFEFAAVSVSVYSICMWFIAQKCPRLGQVPGSNGQVFISSLQG